MRCISYVRTRLYTFRDPVGTVDTQKCRRRISYVYVRVALPVLARNARRSFLPFCFLSIYLSFFLSFKLPGSYVCRGQTIACHAQGTAEQAIKLEFGGRCKNEKSPLPRTQAPESGDDTLHEVFFNLRFGPAPSNGAPSCRRRLRSSAQPAVIDLQMAAHRKRCARAHCVGVSLSLSLS